MGSSIVGIFRLSPWFLNVLLLALVVSSPANCGEIKTYASTQYGVTARHLVFEGAIEQGDADKMLHAIAGFEQPVLSIMFASPGGDLQEGLKISAILNASLIRVDTPTWRVTKKSGGYCWDDEVENDANCMCYSTCALIWLSAIHRSMEGRIGIHRPYYPREQFGRLSANDAEASYANLTVWLGQYLANEGVPQHVVEQVLSTPSTQIHELEPSEMALTPPERPFLFELLDSKCSQSVDRQEQLGLDNEHLEAAKKNDYSGMLIAAINMYYSKSNEHSPYRECKRKALYDLARERQANIFSIMITMCERLPNSAAWVRSECAPAESPKTRGFFDWLFYR
jgi:hypothetical protein